MYLIGLTGGIAAGKSTVAKRWVQQGAIEIDADDLARQVVAPGSAGLKAIEKRFGRQVIAADGTLDRKVLASLVFSDHQELTALNAIVHPLVRELSKSILAKLPNDSIVIYNVPLLVEASVDLDFDLVVTVEAPEEEQIRRLVKIRNMSPDEAKARIRTQAKPVQRAARAGRILSSNQDLALLLRDADSVWQDIVRLAKAKAEQ